VRASLAAALLLAAGWALTFLVWPFSVEVPNDLPVYRAYAVAALDGYLPYHDIVFEYPPLAWPSLALAGLAGTGEEIYRVAFALLMLLCALACLWLVGRLAAATGGRRAIAVLAFALLPLALGALVRTRFDLLPVALLLAALLALAARRPTLGFVLLGLGAATKLFPLVAAPVALAWLLGRGERRAAGRGALALGVTLALALAAGLAASPAGLVDAVRYHTDRPVQVESVPAMGLAALEALGAEEPRSVTSHRSDGLEHPAAASLTALSLGVCAGFLAFLCLAARPPRGEPEEAARRRLVLASLAAVAAFAAFGKVLSPQYLVWTFPLLALSLAWRRWALAGALALATLLTFEEFPFRYGDVLAREPGALVLVAARDLTLVAAVGVAAYALSRGRARAAAGSPSPALPAPLPRAPR
jgi:4-amino-4-deoxy-L-arabinose transferase-like glycosyltransferase